MKIQKYTKNPRSISEGFKNDLKEGMLFPILKHVHRDDNITVEIRSGYINIYYRGGNILRIREKSSGYSFEFDIRYIKVDNEAKGKISLLPNNITTSEQVLEWAKMIPEIKVEMDTYFASHKKAEREFQQLVLRENNIGSIAKKTDYYICDIEYQIRETRFDMIAAKCTSKGKHRLAIIEMKYADSALGGPSGIVDHVHKAYKYLLANDLENLKSEMTGIMETKHDLGLVDDLPLQFAFTNDKPEFIFLLANHQPASGILEKELKKLKTENFYNDFCQMADLKIATANLFGYGFYNECVYTLEEFEEINRVLLKIEEGRKK